MIRVPAEDGPAPPLTWRAWLLLPLVAVALLGVAVPVWRVEVAPRMAKAPPPEPRDPYEDELLDLLRRQDLPMEALPLIKGLHDEAAASRDAEGRIPHSMRERVDALLQRYAGGRPK